MLDRYRKRAVIVGLYFCGQPFFGRLRKAQAGQAGFCSRSPRDGCRTYTDLRLKVRLASPLLFPADGSLATAVLAYRATASWFHAERAKQIVRQRCVEVLAYFNLTLQTSQHPALIQAL